MCVVFNRCMFLLSSLHTGCQESTKIPKSLYQGFVGGGCVRSSTGPVFFLSALHAGYQELMTNAQKVSTQALCVGALWVVLVVAYKSEICLGWVLGLVRAKYYQRVLLAQTRLNFINYVPNLLL
eukprot:NODE_1000_length_1165_cov_93.904122_g759_i0.p1 GENE.NODE_1000_length_1165_cov_93.904122_g759_i0~~NODE_1000_length_1165_cov_93.904122_g759_i0.p1  ORF type:complete len:124 (-),score=20.64 NODE_1000_length_1165_cov_93.904122_g759_i0:173-544(-)